jgi:hypothetical protein
LITIALAFAMGVLSVLRAIGFFGLGGWRAGQKFPVRLCLILLWTSILSIPLAIIGWAFVYSDAPFLLGILIAADQMLRISRTKR